MDTKINSASFRSALITATICLITGLSYAQTTHRALWGPPHAASGRVASPSQPIDAKSASSSATPLLITGSWITSLKNADNYPFKALFSFMLDGNFLGATQGDVCCGENATAQHGSWSADGRHVYMTFYHLDYDPDSGDLVGYARIPFDIQVQDANHWSGTWTAYDYDADGHLLDTDNGTAQGMRITPR